MIVADTNMIYSWVTGDPRLRDAIARVRSRDADWVAPPLWKSEFRNVLVKTMRGQELMLAAAQELCGVAESVMDARTLDVQPSRVLELCAESPVSAYDAEFVALAQQFHLKLVTLDRRLTVHCPDTAILAAEFAAS